MRSIVSGSTDVSSNDVSSPTGRLTALAPTTSPPETPRKNLSSVDDQELSSSTTASPESRKSVVFDVGREAPLEVNREKEQIDGSGDVTAEKETSEEVGSPLRSKDLEAWFPESIGLEAGGSDVEFVSPDPIGVESSQRRSGTSKRMTIVPITIDGDDDQINHPAVSASKRVSLLSPSRMVELETPSHHHSKSFKLDGEGFVIPKAKYGKFGNEKGSHVRRDGLGKELMLCSSSSRTPPSVVRGRDLVDSKVAGQARTTFDVTWKNGVDLMEVRSSPTGEKFLLPTAQLMKQWSLMGRCLSYTNPLKVSRFTRNCILTLFLRFKQCCCPC